MNYHLNYFLGPTQTFDCYKGHSAKWILEGIFRFHPNQRVDTVFKSRGNPYDNTDITAVIPPPPRHPF